MQTCIVLHALKSKRKGQLGENKRAAAARLDAYQQLLAFALLDTPYHFFLSHSLFDYAQLISIRTQILSLLRSSTTRHLKTTHDMSFFILARFSMLL